MSTETIIISKDTTTTDTGTGAAGAEARLPIKLDEDAPIAQSQIDADWNAQQEREIEEMLNGSQEQQPGETSPDGSQTPPAEEIPPEGQPGSEAAGEQPPAATQPAAAPAERNFEAELAQARLEAERAAYGRLGGELQQLRDELKRTREQAAQPPAPPAASQPPPEPSDADLAAVLGDKWQDEWGRDGAVSEYKRLRKAAELFGGGRRGSEDVRAEVRAEIDAERRAVALDRFWQELEQSVPGAGKLNAEAESNGFGAYLAGFQPGTVSKRLDIANAALDIIESGAVGEQRAAAVKVVEDVFKGFWAGRLPAPKTPPKPAGTPAATIDPTKYLMPTTTSGATPPGGETPARKYTQAQVDRVMEQAAAKGDAAYRKAQAWLFEQERLGNVTA
jgi:hypothetical protein